MSKIPAKPIAREGSGRPRKSVKSKSRPTSRSDIVSDDGDASDNGASDQVQPLDQELTAGSDASDESSDDPTSVDAVPEAWLRPSGKNISDYQDWDKWGKRKWAWQFLRRNEDFQRVCLACPANDPLAETKIAETYRLRRFKHFAQEYPTGKKAKFATGIHSIPKRKEFEKRNQNGSGLEKITTVLFPSEVLIKFQLAPTRLAQGTSLDNQITRARRRLDAFAARISKALPNDVRGKKRNAHKSAPERLLAQLRVLDMEKSMPGLNYSRVADILLTNPNQQLSDRDWRRKTQGGQGSNLYERAKELRVMDYLKIAIAGVNKAKS